MRTDFRFCVAILLCCGFLTPTVQGAEVFSFHGMLAGQRVEDALLARGLALAGADVDEQAGYGLVPLHMATNVEVMKTLLDCGANPYALTLAGRSALHYAPDVASLELLVAAGLDVKQKDTFGESALFFAKDAACAAWLIAKMKEAGEDPKVFLNERAQNGQAVLHALCEYRPSAHSRQWRDEVDAWLAGMPGLTAAEVEAYRARLAEFTLDAVLRVLLDAGADVNARSVRGETAAFYANEVETFELLKARGADLRAVNNRGQTLLIASHGFGRMGPEAVRYLIGQGVDVNAVSKSGATALSASAISAPESVKVLLEAGAAPNAIGEKVFVRNMPLFRHNNPECVRLLLEAGADVNARDRFDNSVLHDNRGWCPAEKLKLLIAAGADVNAKNQKDLTPLIGVLDYPELVKVLLEAGAEVNVKDEWEQTPLFSSAFRLKNLETVKLLVEAGAPTVDELTGNTLLHQFRNVEITKYLIENGADVNARDNAGRTPLFLPEYHPDLPEMARLLLEAGADVEARDRWGNTPLIVCSRSLVSILLEAGADVNAKNDTGRTALHHQWEEKHIRLLLAAGADVCAEDDQGKTPLHEILKYGSTAAARALLEAGADVNARDKEGRSVMFTLASSPFRENMADMFLEYGAEVNPGDRFLVTPLHEFCWHGPYVMWLLENGANPNVMDIEGRTPLFRVESRAIYRLLLEAGADPLLRNHDGKLAPCVELFGMDGKKNPGTDTKVMDAENPFGDEMDAFSGLDEQPPSGREVARRFMEAEAAKHGVSCENIMRAYEGDE